MGWRKETCLKSCSPRFSQWMRKLTPIDVRNNRRYALSQWITIHFCSIQTCTAKLRCSISCNLKNQSQVMISTRTVEVTRCILAWTSKRRVFGDTAPNFDYPPLSVLKSHWIIFKQDALAVMIGFHCCSPWQDTSILTLQDPTAPWSWFCSECRYSILLDALRTEGQENEPALKIYKCLLPDHWPTLINIDACQGVYSAQRQPESTSSSTLPVNTMLVTLVWNYS